MKLLCVNHYWIEDSEQSNFVDANVFQDYHAIVIDPVTVEDLFGFPAFRNPEDMDLDMGKRINGLLQGRRTQVNGFLQKGGILVCFLRPMRVYKYRPYTPDETFSNYHWLFDNWDLQNIGFVLYGKGDTVDIPDANHPFYEYMKSKPSWSAYVSMFEVPNWNVFASAYETVGNQQSGTLIEPNTFG